MVLRRRDLTPFSLGCVVSSTDCESPAGSSLDTGFFTDLAVRDPASALPSRDGLAIHGVDVEMDGLAHGAGFVLFVAKGLLATLEGFAFDEQWPAQPENWRITAARVKIMGRSAPPE